MTCVIILSPAGASPPFGTKVLEKRKKVQGRTLINKKYIKQKTNKQNKNILRQPIAINFQLSITILAFSHLYFMSFYYSFVLQIKIIQKNYLCLLSKQRLALPPLNMLSRKSESPRASLKLTPKCVKT